MANEQEEIVNNSKRESDFPCLMSTTIKPHPKSMNVLQEQPIEQHSRSAATATNSYSGLHHSCTMHSTTHIPTNSVVPSNMIVAEKSLLVGSRPSHWTTISPRNAMANPRKAVLSSSSRMSTSLSSPKTNVESTIRQQRVAALRSAAANSTIPKKSSLLSLAKTKTNGFISSAQNNSTAWNVQGTSMNFRPSFLVMDGKNEQEEDTTVNENTRSTLSPQRPRVIGPLMKELLQLRSKRESKILRLQTSKSNSSYSYKCSRFMRYSTTTNVISDSSRRCYVDVTLIGTQWMSFPSTSPVTSILGYVPTTQEEEAHVAYFCFNPEIIHELKLQHGSQLRIYDCLQVKNESNYFYICTSFAEVHPTGLPPPPSTILSGCSSTSDAK